MAVAGSVQANLASDFASTNGGRVPGQQFLPASYGGWPDGQGMARGWHMWYVLERLLQKEDRSSPHCQLCFLISFVSFVGSEVVVIFCSHLGCHDAKDQADQTFCISIDT